MFTEFLFLIFQNQKQPKCPSGGEYYINKLWYIYLAVDKFNRGELLSH